MLRINRRAALVGLMGGALAACASPKTPAAPNPPPSSSPPDSGATPTGSARPGPAIDTRPRWPLTGALLDHPRDAHHAAVAVKVPDNRVEHPQRGIDKADIVFVELEGYRDSQGYSGTRLVPVFHSRMAASVSPVRSIRPVDVALLSPIDVLIGNTGAAPWVINYVQHNRAHLEGMLSYIRTLGTGSYSTDRSRIYSQNGVYYYDRAIICHPAVLARQSTRFRSGPPRPYFPFATGEVEASSVRGRPCRMIKVPYHGDGYFMSYDYDAAAKRYRRSMPWGPHVLADGTRVTTDNVLVIKAKQHYGKIFGGHGGKEPLLDVIHRQGTFYYANRGRYVTGTWRKGAVADRFEFTLANGRPLRMAPGQTFVELPDVGARVRLQS